MVLTGTETKEAVLADLGVSAEWVVSLEMKEGTVQLDEMIFEG